MRKRKTNYRILTHIYGIRKLICVDNFFVGRNGDADIENGLVDTVGERESGKNGESSTDIHTL